MSNNSSIIFELSSIATASDISIVKEDYNKETKTSKLIFKAKLQTAEEVNANKRYYSKNVCNLIVDDLKPQATSRSLFQEIDHPASFGTETDQKRRALTIQLSNCGSLIRDIYVDGPHIIGEVETLSGFRGPDLYSLIKEDKANIGFSVRMFGKMKPHPTIQEVSEVCTPLRAITYDVVTNPSHKNARIMEFIPESYSDYYSGDTLVTESGNYMLTLEGAHVPASSSEILNNYLSSLLNDSFENLRPLKFKI